MNDVRQVLLELNGTFLTASITDYILPNPFLGIPFNFSDSDGDGDSCTVFSADVSIG